MLGAKAVVMAAHAAGRDAAVAAQCDGPPAAMALQDGPDSEAAFSASKIAALIGVTGGPRIRNTSSLFALAAIVKFAPPVKATLWSRTTAL